MSVARLIDLRSLASLGVRVVCEDEHGSVEAALRPALDAAGLSTETVAGEGQPHRRRGMPRWSPEAWVRQHADSTSSTSTAGLLSVTCCLFWTWAMGEQSARELYSHVRYHPALVAAAHAATAPLGSDFAAMHVRRGDKASVDRAYAPMFGAERMSPDYFLRLAADEGFTRGTLQTRRHPLIASPPLLTWLDLT